MCLSAHTLSHTTAPQSNVPDAQPRPPECRAEAASGPDSLGITVVIETECKVQGLFSKR